MRCWQVVKDGSETFAIEESMVADGSDRSGNVDSDEFVASLKSSFANGSDGIGLAFDGDGGRDDDFPFVFVVHFLGFGTLEGDFNGASSFGEVKIDSCAVALGFEVVGGNGRTHAQQQHRDET